MAENAINPLTSPSTMNTSSVAGTTKDDSNSSSIDQQGFMKLFISALANQDPMEPMSNGEMMGQLTQLTQIENTMKMKEAIEGLVKREEGMNPISNFLDLIGKKVKVETENGSKEGEVLSVGKDGSDVVFELKNGETYNVSQIIGATQF